jgi:hypothetical protein
MKIVLSLQYFTCKCYTAGLADSQLLSLASLEVVFHRFKMLYIVLSTDVTKHVESWLLGGQLTGGRAAGGIKAKANPAQLSWDWG